MKTLDETDRRILHLLEANGRIDIKEIAREVGMSGPGAGERVRRLERMGVIERFTVRIDPAALGRPLEAIVRVKPRPGNMHIVESMIVGEPRFTACDKVTGEDCFVARLSFARVQDLDAILGPFHDRAETHTSIVKSSPVRARLPLA